ncbi:hypothetical protein SNQ56_002151 [Cronobacter muytjensii]|nr:hypothetical protein [Cronobacter muytjensii]
MSEEERRNLEHQQYLEKRLKQVTPELFADFLASKGVAVPVCLCCGSDNVGSPQAQEVEVGPNGSRSSVYVSWVKVDTYGPPLSFINYEHRIICRNCGFTSYHSVWPVVKWVEEKLNESKE